jgi:hypothetical protein
VPWRRRPQAASITLTALILVAAAAGLRRPPEQFDTVLPFAAGSSAISINDALTRDEAGCASVRATLWHPLSGVDYTGRLTIALPPQMGGAIVLYVGDAVPLDVEVHRSTGDWQTFALERMVAGPGVSIPPDFWLEDGSPDRAPRHIARLQIDAQAERALTLKVSLGRRAPRVLARLVNYAPDARVPVCADQLGAGETYFATGWYGEEQDAAGGSIRWMREHGAVLVMSPHGGPARIRLRAAPVPTLRGDEASSLTIRVNDMFDLEPRQMQEGMHEYEWSVPATAWVAGTNELLFTVTRARPIGSRTLGLALASLHVD